MYHVPYIFFLIHRKKAFEKKHNKVHLNLSIALFLGLVTFVSGIESATGNKVNLMYTYIHNTKITMTTMLYVACI